MVDLLVLILIIIVLIGYVIYRRKKVAKLKAEGKKQKTYLGCTLPALIGICILVFSIFYGVLMMGNFYDDYEKKGNKIHFDQTLDYFNSSSNYQDLSNTQKRIIAVKLFLLINCDNGEDTLKKLIGFEQNILYKACVIVQNNNIYNKFSEYKLIKSNFIVAGQTGIIDHLENLNELPKKFYSLVFNVDFKDSIKLYDWYINE